MSNTCRYRLGLPAWAFPGWKDRYFVDRPSRIASYARVFNSVEGNTTFYRTPDPQTVERWLHSLDGTDFRFCFKLPRGVTHVSEPELAELEAFLNSVAPLAAHLGPFLLQFPASVAPARFAEFESVFEQVASVGPFVVEVRHEAFFREPELLEDLLATFGAGRVILDPRPIYEGNRSHPEVLAALHEKPNVPVLPAVYNELAFVRLILHPDMVSNVAYIDEWATRIAAWMTSGVDCWIMIHCPNNLHCPPLAVAFHETLCKKAGKSVIPALPLWPVPQQLDLL